MNIKELSELADKLTAGEFATIEEYYTARDQQFARLIVQECATFIEDTFDLYGDEIGIANDMVEHFK